MVLILRTGDRISRREVLARLVAMQYTRNDADFTRGVFRVRGETIDIFPAESPELALRLTLFDDEIESLELFDPLTGRVRQKLPRFTVYPGSHYVTPRETVLRAIETIKEELRERLAQLIADGKLVEAQRLEQRTRFDLEMLQELGFCKGIENYSRHLSGAAPGEPPPTLDRLPAGRRADVHRRKPRHHRAARRHVPWRPFAQGNPGAVWLPAAVGAGQPAPAPGGVRGAHAPVRVRVGTPAAYEQEHADNVVEQVVRPTGLVDPIVEVRPAHTQVDDLLGEIHKRAALQERVLVTTLTKRMAEDLTDFLSEHGVRVRYLHSDIDTVERVEIIRDLRLGVFDVLVGINLLREGLDIPEVSLVAILDADKGRLPAIRAQPDTDDRPGRPQPEWPGHSLRRPHNRLDAACHRRDRAAQGQADPAQHRPRHHRARGQQGRARTDRWGGGAGRP